MHLFSLYKHNVDTHTHTHSHSEPRYLCSTSAHFADALHPNMAFSLQKKEEKQEGEIEERRENVERDSTVGERRWTDRTFHSTVHFKTQL